MNAATSCSTTHPFGLPTKARAEDDDPVDHLFKVIVIGESTVGKTNILSRFARNEFNVDCKSTIGVELATLPFWLDGKLIKLQIWDTAGQERYRAITAAYYRGAAGVLLVYDVTDRKSFARLEDWLEEIAENGEEDMVITLVGNKSDLKEKRAVSRKEAEALSEAHKMAYFETSARDGRNVDEAFHDLLTSMYAALAERDMEKQINSAAIVPSSDVIRPTAKNRRFRSKIAACCS
jgi:Ras-related protein Rab-11A